VLLGGDSTVRLRITLCVDAIAAPRPTGESG
jgi:hypothetical protein